jgi:acetolactate synthase-1/3 small subunit
MSTTNEPISYIAMLVHDRPGVMMKITGMFARRGFNIASITVGHSERPNFSRITIGVEGDSRTVEQIMKQLNKLIDVVKVQRLNLENTTVRVCCLVKIAIKDHVTRDSCITMIDLYKAKAIDVTIKSMTIEIVGSERKIDSFINVISEIAPIKEIVRSGVIAISRGDRGITLD